MMRIHRFLVIGAATIALAAGTAFALPGAGPDHDSGSDAAAGRVAGPATVLDMAQVMAQEGTGGTIDPGPPPGAKVIVVAGRGVAPNTSTEPGRTQFAVPLYDVLTGEKVGTSTHDFICDGFFSCTDTDTYYLPQGSLRVTATVSFNNDGERPGWVLVGAAPKEHALDGTGEFAGKTGSVRVNGWAGLEDMPEKMRLDEIYVITYR